tara:strand:- start:12075 stop:14003 length:1929 start_codon:yes stop_codon:yes gene_type:complete
MAIVLSVSILLGFQIFIEAPRLEKERASREAQKVQDTAKTVQPVTPGAIPPAVNTPGVLGAAPPASANAPVAGQPAMRPKVSREKVLNAFARVKIVTDRVIGSIRLKGALIDDLTLLNYRQTIDENSPNIVLLSPLGTTEAYYAQFGWVSQTADITVPGADTVWTADRENLSIEKPVTLRWTNAQGVEFIQTISLDKNFMFSIQQKVRNGSEGSVTINPFGLISLTGTPETSGFWILHEGMTGAFNGTLFEESYSSLQDEDDGLIAPDGQTNWIGITAKYFATALVPDQKTQNKGRWVHSTSRGQSEKYQADYLASASLLAPGETGEYKTRLFAGAKEVKLLDSYRDKLSLPVFDKLVDFGWFYYLTKPIFYAIEYFNRILGNFGLAILLLTVLIKIAFFPLANKSYRSMSRLKKLQPKMIEIRDRYKDDRQRQNQAMMELYKKEGANPMSGCFPILIQIPVFFALYKVLFVTIEMRHAPFFGWIQDLSAPDPLGILILFGLIPWDVPQALTIVNVGIWPIIMGLTMFLQQKLNPQPADPMQAKIFMVLPIVFTFLLGGFPAGLVIYWAWNNTLSIAQQWVIMRQMGVSASGESINEEIPKAPPRGNSRKEPPKKETDNSAPPQKTTKAKAKGKTRRQRKRR